ncbi:MAG: hypothetical protein H0U77_15180 [Nocardioidaceae bacterium]|nr:hypothetical protein [Nocardioidaceae bacterium]
MATGTQVLEMRDSDNPEAADFSITGRLECATWYLALGGGEGNAVRSLVWEGDGTTWRHSTYVSDLSTAHGLTPAQYEEFRGPLSDWLPPADHPKVLRRMRDHPADASSKKSKRRFISYADMADLLTAGEQGATV